MKPKFSDKKAAEKKSTEDEYVQNLQQQAHFMELEIKLLKEKQDEEEKGGGFSISFTRQSTH